MIKALIIFGTRPEAVKLAPIIRELRAQVSDFDTKICVTAQHRGMLDQVLDIFGIVPDYDLNIMEEAQTLDGIVARSLGRLHPVLADEAPDVVLVQGDTTTCFSAALAAHHQRIDVGHVEAGLRSGDKLSPWPEEANRRLVSVLADYHFAPTNWARENLLREGVAPENIHVTGNTVVDAVVSVRDKVRKDEDWCRDMARRHRFLQSDRKLVLVTAHRRENFGGALQELCNALRILAEEISDIEIVFPVHPNPNVGDRVRKYFDRLPAEAVSRIHIVDPFDYELFVHVMDSSYLILTDSGGIQEEAPSLGKPVLIMRDNTERPEGVEAGAACLIGMKSGPIVKAVTDLVRDEARYQSMATSDNPFGDGLASERIVAALRDGLRP